jgi:hypothetical protein
MSANGIEKDPTGCGIAGVNKSTTRVPTVSPEGALAATRIEYVVFVFMIGTWYGSWKAV